MNDPFWWTTRGRQQRITRTDVWVKLQHLPGSLQDSGDREHSGRLKPGPRPYRRRYSQCCHCHRLVFPYVNGLPASPTKNLIVELVASFGPFDFWYPVIGVGLRGRPMAGAAVPVAPIP